MTLPPTVSLGSWVRATSLGWLLGIPLIAGFALLGEAIGIGGAQVLVGVGMGTGIGLLQGRIVRQVLTRAWPWVVASTVGLALPFLVIDVAHLLHRDLPYNLQVAVALGGVSVGACQAWLLRRHVARPLLWMVVSLAGWALAALPTLGADRMFRTHAMRGLWGGLLYLGLLAIGGLVLGLVTGPALRRLLTPPTPPTT